MPYGAGGIRTPGTLSGHNSLAGSPIRPLSHRSSIGNFFGTIKYRDTFTYRLGAGGIRGSSRKLLFAPSTPAFALLGASMHQPFSRQGLRLEILTATLRFESPNDPLIY